MEQFMAYCDSCGNFDDIDRTLEESKEQDNYQPDLYLSLIHI